MASSDGWRTCGRRAIYALRHMRDEFCTLEFVRESRLHFSTCYSFGFDLSEARSAIFAGFC